MAKYLSDLDDIPGFILLLPYLSSWLQCHDFLSFPIPPKIFALDDPGKEHSLDVTPTRSRTFQRLLVRKGTPDQILVQLPR